MCTALSSGWSCSPSLQARFQAYNSAPRRSLRPWAFTDQVSNEVRSATRWRQNGEERSLVAPDCQRLQTVGFQVCLALRQLRLAVDTMDVPAASFALH